ncbi:MAG: phage holin family protein [Minisyncoccia bacterium]
MRVLLQKIILQIILNAIAVLALEHFHVLTFDGDLVTLLKLSAVIGTINIFLRPILSFVSKPLIWITFGLFAIVLNLILLKIAMALVPEFNVTGFSNLLISSLILGIANILATVNKQT